MLWHESTVITAGKEIIIALSSGSEAVSAHLSDDPPTPPTPSPSLTPSTPQPAWYLQGGSSQYVTSSILELNENCSRVDTDAAVAY